MVKIRHLVIAAIAMMAGLSPAVARQADAARNTMAGTAEATTQSRQLGQLGCGFVANAGQIHDQNNQANGAVKYLLNMPGLNVQLRADGFSYDAYAPSKEDKSRLSYHRVDVSLEGANPDAQLLAEKPSGAVMNFLSGGSAISGVHTYGKVTYRNIYPGIDLEFVASSGKTKPVEYNFIVHPGADASAIRMRYSGANSTELKDGKIVMSLATGTLAETIPSSYIEKSGQKLNVAYLAPDNSSEVYAFNVPAYDRSKTLVIDPTPEFIWGTFFGGANGGSAAGVATDASGNVYVALNASDGGLATSGAYQSMVGPTAGGKPMVAKFNVAGNLLWATYFGALNGGTNAENASGIAVDPSGNAYLCGVTTSSTNVASAGSYQSTFGGGSNDGFLAKINASGTALLWATYYGGGSTEYVQSVAADASGNAYIAGITSSTNGIATAGTFLSAAQGVSDGFVAKFSSSGARVWGSYYGGAGSDEIKSVAVDNSGNVIVAGLTGLSSVTGQTSSNLATTGAFQIYDPNISGYNVAFIGKLSSTGTRIWGTYYGNAGNYINSNSINVAADVSGNIFFTGASSSTANYFGTTGTYKPIGVGNFLSKFASTGARTWSTYITGDSWTFPTVATDIKGNSYVLVSQRDASGQNISTPNAPQATINPGNVNDNDDLALAKFNTSGQLVWGTYYGGDDEDDAVQIAVDVNCNVYVTGNSFSSGPGIGKNGYQNSNPAPNPPYGYINTPVLGHFSQGYVPSGWAITHSAITANQTQTVCRNGFGAFIRASDVYFSAPTGFSKAIFYQWQYATANSGPWMSYVGETSKDVLPQQTTSTLYYRRIAYTTINCDSTVVDSTPVATVNVNANTAPVVLSSATGAYFSCPGSTVSFTGSATGGTSPYTYEWFQGPLRSAGGTPASTSASYTPSPTVTTIYTLRVTDSAGCVNADQTTITIVTADAGPNVNLCQGSPGVKIGALAVPGNTYSWTPSTGLSCTTCAQPVVSGITSATTYTLTVTTPRMGGGTCTTTSSVTVTPIGPPNGNAFFGGMDRTICRAGNTATSLQLGTAAAAGFTYTWNPGNYLSSTITAQPYFFTGTNIQAVNCPMTYTVTAVSPGGGCAFSDQVSVTMINEFLDAPAPACGPRYVGQAAPITCPGTTYAWALTSGSGTILSGTNSDRAYLKDNSPTTNAVFTRTSTLNGVSCQASATVTPDCGCVMNIQVVSRQACAKVFAGLPLTLSANGNIASGNASIVWSDNITGSPSTLVDNPYSTLVNVTYTGQVTFTATITDNLNPTHSCSASLAVNNPGYTLPNQDYPNKMGCPNVNISLGLPSNYNASYSYVWQPNATLSCTSCPSPNANASTDQKYNVTITSDPSSGSCVNTDTVHLYVSAVTADAGPDRLVCYGAAVTLGTPRPTGGAAYTYAWTPNNMGGAYVNGTNSSQPQPQVLYSSAVNASQQYSVVVTDPATGCSAYDTVVLNSTSPVAYGGPSQTVCPHTPTQLGVAPIPGVTYSWSPSAGLSCSTCAQPTVTNPTATTTYTVTVTYPGAPGYASCSQSSNTTLTVLPTGTISYPNQTYCPGNPVTLSGTVTGSPVAYAWSPATGLSCNTCANPVATPTAATSYTLRVTFGGGCTETATVTVTPAAAVTAGSDQFICPGATTGVTLGQPAVAGYAYSWSPATGLSCTTCAQPVALPTSTTTYTLTANNGTCNAVTSVTVTVQTLPTLTVSGKTNLCANTCTTLTVTSSTTGMSFAWSPTTGVASPYASTTSVCPTATTTYRVTQTQISTGCQSYLDVPVTIDNTCGPITPITNDVNICEGSSVVLPLTVSPTGPAYSYSFSWTPTATLSNPFIQNPTAYPTTTTVYTVTITNDNTGASTNADVRVNVTPAGSCLATDYGDAPNSYNGTNGANPASATVSNTIHLGPSIDGELSALYAAAGGLATRDDLDNGDDEDGVENIPGVTTSDNIYSIVIPSTYNTSGSSGTAVAWIDWNGDGDFDDAGERSTLSTVPSNTGNPQITTLVWTGFNDNGQVKAGHTYMRVRISTDNSAGWQTNPSPVGGTTDGEVEDYDVTIMGEDWGDMLGEPTARALVNPDLNNDGKPDATGSLWLGAVVDYHEHDNPANATADGDDIDGVDDEDGLTPPASITAGVAANWTVTSNSTGTASGNVGMWIDWNGDGDFTDGTDQFYSATVSPNGTPVNTVFSVTPPAGLNATGYVVRIGIQPSSATPFAKTTPFTATVTNGEFEDYLRITPLPVTLTGFWANKEGKSVAALTWKTTTSNNDIATFVLSRSGNGKDWTDIANVAANGSTAAADYSYNDKHPLSGINYYRLTIKEKAGTQASSPVRTLMFEGDAAAYNVVGQQGAISIRGGGNEPAGYTVFAADGSMIARGSITPGVNVTIPVTAAGIYLVRINDSYGSNLVTAKTLVR